MTPEVQRIVIAEACGLRFSDHEYQTAWPENKKYRAGGWYKGDEFVGGIPDYPNDLNAMHEAEKVLGVITKREFASALMEVVRRYPVGCVPDYHHDLESLFEVSHATAAQRAEAFLRTLELWKD